MQVRIGVSDNPNAIEIEVEDAEQLIAEVEQAFRDGQPLFRFTDREGRLVVVPLGKLAYLEVEPEKSRWVGFATAE